MSSWEIDRPLEKETQDDEDEEPPSPQSVKSSIPNTKAVAFDTEKLKDATKPPPPDSTSSELGTMRSHQGSAKVMHPRMSEQFWYCRSKGEFEHYKMSRTDGFTKRTTFNFSLGDLLLPRVVESSAAHAQRASLTPYGEAVWRNASPRRAQVGGEKLPVEHVETGSHRGKSKPSMQGSVSLPVLAHSPMPEASKGEKRSSIGATAASMEGATELPSLPGVSPTLS